jgi:TPR repeat protein
MCRAVRVLEHAPDEVYHRDVLTMRSRKTYVTSTKYRRSGDFYRILEDFMKRALLAIVCGAALLVNSIAYADAVSDREMADRYSQAAQSGDSEAQFYMGALYSSGVGRPRSNEEAFRWFSRAADQGHSHAMLVLAGLYAIGRGTSNDNLAAYKWAYIVSVGTRVEEFRNGARQLIGVLEARMTPEQINQAKADAGGWRAVRTQAKPAVPTDSVRQDSQPPAPAASKQAPASPATGSADSSSPQGPRSSNIKKDDMDAILEQIPSGLRKRFGF